MPDTPADSRVAPAADPVPAVADPAPADTSPVNPDAAPAPAAPVRKTPRTRAPVNRAFSREIVLAREIAATAQKDVYAPLLAAEEIDAVFIEKLLQAIEAAHVLLAAAVGNTTDRKSDTRSEQALKDALLLRIATVQARVKRKYPKAGTPARSKFYIGQLLSNSRSLLDSGATAILFALAAEPVPGMKPADIAALRTALAEYRAVQTDQAGDQSHATTSRSRLKDQVGEVAVLRRQLQYAVDAAWPAREKGNAGVRVEFKLNPARAMR